MCVFVCVSGWDSWASSATAAPATLLEERGERAEAGGEEGDRKEWEGESPGPNKAMGARTGLGPPTLL